MPIKKEDFSNLLPSLEDKIKQKEKFEDIKTLRAEAKLSKEETQRSEKEKIPTGEKETKPPKRAERRFKAEQHKFEPKLEKFLDWLDEVYGGEIIQINKIVVPQELAAWESGGRRERRSLPIWPLIRAKLVREIERGVSYQIINPTSRNQLLRERVMTLPTNVAISWPELHRRLFTRNRQAINKLLNELTEYNLGSGGVMVTGFKSGQK